MVPLLGAGQAFFGPPCKALSYFRVDRYAELFRQLDKQAPSAWSLSASADPEQRAFLRRAGPPLRQLAAQESGLGGPTSADKALDRLKARLGRSEVT